MILIYFSDIKMFTLEDEKGAGILRNLSKSFSFHPKTFDSFVLQAFQQLQDTGKLWQLKWDKYIKPNNVVCFECDITWPYCHVIPYDLFPKIHANFCKMNKNVTFYFPKKQRIGIKCDWISKTIDNDYFSVTCDRCGNIWDGNAQCFCWKDFH